jgi:hypothetical protein
MLAQIIYLEFDKKVPEISRWHDERSVQWHYKTVLLILVNYCCYILKQICYEKFDEKMLTKDVM